MGYFGIPLKPSTILVFSIAFGISVDNAIQFMAKYRLDLLQNNGKSKNQYSVLYEKLESVRFILQLYYFLGLRFLLYPVLEERLPLVD